MGDLVVGFDLDMTLIDSRPGILATLWALSEETGVAIDGELVVSRLGPTLETEMAEWYPEERIAAVSDRFRELYTELGVPGCHTLPGADDALAAVKSAGGRTIVITAKYEPNARKCLEYVGLTVDDVIGWRYGPGKATALTEHGASVYVGDTPTDVAAAHAAGAVGVAVPTGPHPADELRAAGTDVLLETLRDFPAWFGPWRQAL
ncbi:MAG: HAD family hydrolase [Acidimicrobiia bacterium]